MSRKAFTSAAGHCDAALELDPELTVLSIDEMGAYDVIKRQAMLGKQQSEPKL